MRAVFVNVTIQDSGAAGTDCYLILSGNDTAGSGQRFDCAKVNDPWARYPSVLVPCDANGDIYYQIEASGAGTFDAYISIWSYYL